MFMNEIRKFPIDEITGLPHVILTTGLSKDIPSAGKTNHHHANYQRQHPDLEGHMLLSGPGNVLSSLDELSLGKLGGLAVRVSRTQRLEPVLHTLLHIKFPEGSDKANALSDKFVTAVENCAGVVSRTAVDVTAAEGHEFVHMDDDTFAKVVNPWRLHIEEYYYDRPEGYQKRVLGSFFMRYASEQDLGHISPDIIDEFLSTSDPGRKTSLGRDILREAVDVSIEPVAPIHQELRRLGMIQAASKGLRHAVWSNTPNEMIAPALQLLANKFAV